MKECPNCGHIDPPYWRSPPHYPELDYVRPNDLAVFDPDLFKLLVKAVPFERDGDPNIYRISETGKWVYRIWKPIWSAFGPGGWTQFRRTKMFDSAGRLKKDNWAALLRAKVRMAAYKRSGIKLDAFTTSTVIPHEPEGKT